MAFTFSCTHRTAHRVGDAGPGGGRRALLPEALARERVVSWTTCWQPRQSGPPALCTLPPARAASHFFVFRTENATESNPGARHVTQAPRPTPRAVPQHVHDGTAAIVVGSHESERPRESVGEGRQKHQQIRLKVIFN